MVVGLTAFLLASGAAYFVYCSKTNSSFKLSQVPILKQVFKGASSNPPTSTQGSQATQAINTYQGWKTFSSTKYSIKYPGDWFDTRDNSLKQSSPYEMFISNESVIFPKSPSAIGIQVHSNYLTGSNFPDVDKTAFSTPNGNFKISGTYDTNIIFTKLADLKLQGYPAIEYAVDGSADNNNLNYTLQYDINKNGDLYYVSFSFNKSHLNGYSNQIQEIINSLTIN